MLRLKLVPLAILAVAMALAACKVFPLVPRQGERAMTIRRRSLVLLLLIALALGLGLGFSLGFKSGLGEYRNSGLTGTLPIEIFLPGRPQACGYGDEEG